MLLFSIVLSGVVLAVGACVSMWLPNARKAIGRELAWGICAHVVAHIVLWGIGLLIPPLAPFIPIVAVVVGIALSLYDLVEIRGIVVRTRR